MVIFAVCFMGSLSFISAVIAGIFASTDALLSMCSLIIFACVALAIATRSRYAWTAMFLAILAMVALDVLAPYAKVLAYVIAFMLSCFITWTIKVPLLRYIRIDALSTHPRLSAPIRTVLRII